MSSAFQIVLATVPWLELTALAGIGCFVYTLIEQDYISPLAKVPGPRISALTEFILNMKLIYAQENTDILKLHNAYGPIVRTGPNTIWVSSANLIRKVNGSHKYLKGKGYNFLRIGKANLFNTRDPGYHRTQKRLMLPAFTSSALSAIEPLIIDVGVARLVERIRAHADSGSAVDLMNLIRNMTFDVIGEVGFGKTFGLLEENKEQHPIIQWINDTVAYVARHYMLGKLFSPRMFPNLTRSVESFENYARDAIQRRRQAGSNRRKDTLQNLLKLSMRKLVPQWQMKILDQSIAGTDTTAITLTCLPDPNTRISYNDIAPMRYLDAVFHEAMRLRPVIAHGMPRVVPQEGATLDDYFVPGGTTVMVSTIAMHMNEQIFPDPHKFYPDRWLNASPEQLAIMKINFAPFSVGPRACIGRNLAWMELRLTLVELLRHFTLVPSLKNDMQPVFSSTTNPRGNQFIVQPYRAY
ncbi:cytochrome P450 [Syncephalis fuscata]|nr:cytochrome P450 [Syncephalis fuscata]